MSPAPRIRATSIVTQLAQQIGVSTTVAANGSEFDLHRQRRHPVPGYAAHRFLHPDADAGRWREWRRGHRRRRADHRRQFADAHSIGRARRLCGGAGYARARISGPARPDRRRPHQRLRRKRSVGDPYAALAAGPVHHGGSDQPALDVGDDRSRRRDRGQSECRPVAGRQSESAARRRHLRPRKSGLYLQHDRRGELYGTHPGAHRPDQRDAELRSIRRPRLIGEPHRLRQRLRELASSRRTSRRATPPPIRTRSQRRRPRRCRTRPASISTPK